MRCAVRCAVRCGALPSRDCYYYLFILNRTKGTRNEERGIYFSEDECWGGKKKRSRRRLGLWMMGLRSSFGAVAVARSMCFGVGPARFGPLMDGHGRGRGCGHHRGRRRKDNSRKEPERGCVWLVCAWVFFGDFSVRIHLSMMVR